MEGGSIIGLVVVAASVLAAACGPGQRSAAGTGGGTTTSSSDDGECPELVHEGDLYIAPPGTINEDGVDLYYPDTDLASVPRFTRVTEKVSVATSDAEDLAFLHCLREVDELSITSENLETLEGLDNLESVRSLSVVSNSSLRSLEGLDALRHVDQVAPIEEGVAGILVAGNPALTALGLDQLETVASLSIGLSCNDGPELGGNASLVDVTGLSGLTSVGALHLDGNASLASLDGLRVLAENDAIVGFISARHNPSLASEHVLEIAALLGADSRTGCNQGAEDDESCTCDVVSE